jgi:hypothetical protein
MEPKLLAGAGAGAIRNFGSTSSSETGIPTSFLFTKRALYEKKIFIAKSISLLK